MIRASGETKKKMHTERPKKYKSFELEMKDGEQEWKRNNVFIVLLAIHCPRPL